MTAGKTDEQHDIDSAMASIWRQHRENSLARIDVIEDAVAKIVRDTVTEADLEEAVSAAHKLAGSLGTFGYEDGSRIALATETLLREQQTDGRLLAESVSELRASVEQTPMPVEESDDEDGDGHHALEIENEEHRADERAATPADDHEGSDGSAATVTGRDDVVLVTDDTELAARLIAASARAGMTCRPVTSDIVDFGPTSEPDGRSAEPNPGSLVLIDSACTNEEGIVALIERHATNHPVAVLTGTIGFEQRLRLARAGIVATIPRSQAPKNTIDFLSTTVLFRRSEPWQVALLGDDSKLAEILETALSEHRSIIDRQPTPDALWKSLDGVEADLIVLGQPFDDPSAADLCRIIRAEPDHHRTPIVIHGSFEDADIADMFGAGADDVVAHDAPADEIRGRLQRIVTRTTEVSSESGLDRTTGIENRDSVERSLDRLLGLAARRDEPFAMARLRFDQLDAIVDEHGGVVGDLVLRRVADTIRSAVRGTDVHGRWSSNELVIGFSSADRSAAEQRIRPLLEEVADQELTAPSGRSVRCQFRWHLAIAPDDGTTLASLDRIGENALASGPGSSISLMAESAVRDEVDVVVVEDDDSIADVISYALGLRGYTSRRFIDGADAAEALVGGIVSGRVVLLDVGLPSLDGFGILGRLGTSGVGAKTHVIMLTARSSEAERLRALDLGATEHIGKPFSIPVLLGRLDQILAEGRP